MPVLAFSDLVAVGVGLDAGITLIKRIKEAFAGSLFLLFAIRVDPRYLRGGAGSDQQGVPPVSYTHLRAHETVLDLVCRLLLEKKTNKYMNTNQS